MIHLLEIHPELSTAELKKLSRRYAMTGGYELVLASGLKREDLKKMVALFGPELEGRNVLDSKCRASNAYRIMVLIQRHECADTEVFDLIQQHLPATEPERNLHD